MKFTSLQWLLAVLGCTWQEVQPLGKALELARLLDTQKHVFKLDMVLVIVRLLQLIPVIVDESEAIIALCINIGARSTVHSMTLHGCTSNSSFSCS